MACSLLRSAYCHPSNICRQCLTHSPAYKGTVTFPLGLYINGEFVDPVEGGTIDVMNPPTGKFITSIAAGTKADIDLAARAAKAAFKASWGFKTPGVERGKMLFKLADLVEQRIDEFAALDTLTNGKTFKTTAHGDCTSAIAILRYYAGWADKITGKTIETNDNKMTYTRHEPIGVVGQIIPWNVPMYSVAVKSGPALATGNTVVLKPSELTPLSVLLFCTLLADAGFPRGVVNVVNGYGPTAGQAISEHPLIGKVAFTGSTLTGRKIMEAAAKSNLKPVTLELGGKSPVMIFEDAASSTRTSPCAVVDGRGRARPGLDPGARARPQRADVNTGMQASTVDGSVSLPSYPAYVGHRVCHAIAFLGSLHAY
ncbi:Aldehyde dehydrogenase [Sparassis crispa]|uniref:Aldehyde dehydrogenase n=1 Tax=Sparassis crispa TaxID=139825 RepID=A0A401GND9_9APHY|nr:Aldehyde dehydrogenase [Sparassis crispa]GBE83712.1 Aldehyde dehydrogenase [Sparassis crispa]